MRVARKHWGIVLHVWSCEAALDGYDLWPLHCLWYLPSKALVRVRNAEDRLYRAPFDRITSPPLVLAGNRCKALCHTFLPPPS